MKNAAQWGMWGENRDYILIHLAPSTGIHGKRQTGSHGCISTKDEANWSLFVSAMSKCAQCKKPEIKLRVINETSIGLKAEKSPTSRL